MGTVFSPAMALFLGEPSISIPRFFSGKKEPLDPLHNLIKIENQFKRYRPFTVIFSLLK